MKVFEVIGTAALLFVLGYAAPAAAQDEHHEQDAKPAQHEEQAKPAKPEEQAKAPKEERPEAKPATQEHAQAQKQPARASAQQAAPQQAKAEQSQPHQQQAKSVKPVEQKQAQAQQRQVPQRSVAQQQQQRSAPALRLSARTSSRIPDDRFRSSFGREHTFRMSPTMVGGYSRFQYGGYWFGFVQPWPVGWYYTDDVYVEYIDGGYYLCDPYYPDGRVSISVVL